MNKKYNGKLRKTAVQMIVRDGQTISTFLLNVPYKGVVSLLLFPYIGLYCKEAEEFFGIKVIDSMVEKQITDLRNSIKICDKYNKSEGKFLLIDDEQDDYYRNLLRYDFTKNWNIHYCW